MKKTISWVEIPATNMERAVSFYNKLLGLEMKIIDFGSEKMACLPGDEGAITLSPDIKPATDGVLVSLNVEDRLEEALLTLVDNGGSVVKSKTKIEAAGRGYFALFIDSEGNKVGLYGDS